MKCSWSLFIIFVLSTVDVHADRALDWFQIDCPGSVANQSCTYSNTYDNDIAVSLFFQTEDLSGSSFTCSRSIRSKSSSINSKLKSELTCPTPMVYQYYNTWSYCLLEDLTFPSDLSKVGEYCDYLTQGYEGFYFSGSDFPDYSCPSSMYQSTSSDGTVFCVFNLPQSTVNALPNDTESWCTDEAFKDGELGFRFDNNGTTTMPPTTPVPSMNNDDEIIYCSRKYVADGDRMSQLGSAGDCYFILPAGESFSCQGSGDTNVITAYAVELNDTYFDTSGSGGGGINVISDISKGYTNDDKSNNNKLGSDAMIYVEVESLTIGLANFDCYYNDGDNDIMFSLCNFTAEHATGSVYSCNFVLPWMASMECDFDKTEISVTSAVVRNMLNGVKLFGDNATAIKNDILPQSMGICPNATYPQATDCDCYFENPFANNDVLIIMNALNTDNQFNSFHCFMYGVNVCAWGADNDNNDDMGGCWFILPAQSMYNCTMEWGSTAFLQTTAIKLETTIFPPADEKIKHKKHRKHRKHNNNRNVKGVKLPPSRDLSEMTLLWYKWKENFGKVYDTLEEDLKRFKNFQHFVSLMDNSAVLKGKYEKTMEILNENADLSEEEFEAIYKGCNFGNVKLSDLYDDETKMYKFPTNLEYDVDKTPDFVDWTQKGAVTPVKNQGQCGGCWAFSTTGVIESHFYIAENELQSLSEQNLVSCDNRDGNEGCDGGWPYLAIQYVADNGIDTEASYNYTSGDGDNGICRSNDGVKADVTGYIDTYQFVERDEDAMATYVANYGPISISLDAMTQIWWPYTSDSGVIKSCCDKDVDHAVLIVGYNMTSSDESEHYWIIKNSWGTDWGYDGYIYLQMGTDQCGITSQPVVPKMKT